jgi:radical SAM superfamily enzyme YgiQ (UPF0313 family)
MARILLTTLNAKYIHASFGLRYLLANLGALRSEAALAEFEITQRPIDIVEAILEHDPEIVGFGVYIWNVGPTQQVLTALKQIRPELTLILGGPEVSHATDQQAITTLADYVITGEADLAFAHTCRQILDGSPPGTRTIAAPLPDLAAITLPYDLYTDDDVAHRIVYVEASRGCPFSCEFCLSSLDIPVRQFPLPGLLESFQQLLARGINHFKFVDRTFNLNIGIATQLLEFFHRNHRPGLFLHFELVPDRLPDPLREWIARFPAGALQFEIGVQTFNPEVSTLISRRQDLARLEANFKFLREQTGVHIHADLIAGLPGESLTSFADGFDRLLALRPHEIQVGILKRLRGTPIGRHDRSFHMVYSPEPPYEILQNQHLDFATLQRLRRFARYWDLVYNSGRFIQTAPLLWDAQPSPFAAFLRWTEWLHQQTGRRHGIALNRLAVLLFRYLTEELAVDTERAVNALRSDFARDGRTDVPSFLRRPDLERSLDRATETASDLSSMRRPPRHARRQRRHHQTPGSDNISWKASRRP